MTDESAALTRIRTLGTELDSARKFETELSSRLADARAFDRFATGRQSMTRFLAELTELLPNGAWVANLSVDSSGGRIVVIGPSTSEILSALIGAQFLDAPALEGSVSPERLGDDRLERSTIRFRWRQQSVLSTRPATPAPNSEQHNE